MSKYFSADYLIFPGMFATYDFVDCETYNMAKKMCEQGTKIIFLGLGQAKYTDEETEYVLEKFKDLNIELIVSRDAVTYNNFKDYFPTINGIDCAFWVKNTYDPRTKVRNMYDVVTYNRGKKRQIPKTNKDIVTAYHMQYFLKPEYVKDNMLISDTPYDYLTLYANADNVYTDLVHATIISLSYGRHVLFDRTDNRSYAIDALSNIIEYDNNGFMHISESVLEKKKTEIQEEIENKLSFL